MVTSAKHELSGVGHKTGAPANRKVCCNACVKDGEPNSNAAACGVHTTACSSHRNMTHAHSHNT